MLSCVFISYTHEWNVLKSQHFLPFKKEELQCDNASIMTSHLRMSFCFSKIFFGSWEIFHTYCNSSKMITHSFFSPKVKRDSSRLSLRRTAERGWLLISRPFQALGKLWQQWAAWLKTACHGLVSNTKMLCAYVFIYLKFCDVYSHVYVLLKTHIHIYTTNLFYTSNQQSVFWQMLCEPSQCGMENKIIFIHGI